MKCERGDHGEMFLEIHPTAYRCETCGHMEYPTYADHVADGADTGARRHLSHKAKRQRKAIIESLVERGYTNREISETTGYTLDIVRRNAAPFRKTLDKAHSQRYN